MQQPSFLMGPPCLIFRSATSMPSFVLLVCVQLASLAIILPSRHHCMCCVEAVHHVCNAQLPTWLDVHLRPCTRHAILYNHRLPATSPLRLPVSPAVFVKQGLIGPTLLGHQLPWSQTHDITRAAELLIILCQQTNGDRWQSSTGIAQCSMPRNYI